MDALESYCYLVDNLPSWLSKLEDLSDQVSKQHTEFMRLTRTTEVKLARQKTGSTESLRPHEESRLVAEHKEQPLHITVTSIPATDSQHSKVNNVLAIKEARRKRKPGSSSSAASGSYRYRTRSMVIVYYDSEIQNSFETLVRNIATARNNLRKGKTAATFKARMASLGMGPIPFSAGGRRSMLDPKTSRMPKKDNPDNTTSAFDFVDQDLERAQSLCESAAHQLLRDGDCSDEIQRTKQGFENALQIAMKEAERLQKEKAQEPLEEERDLDVDQKDEKPSVPIDVSPIPVTPTVKPIQFAGIGAIEVDDNSDSESVHVDLSVIRRATRRV